MATELLIGKSSLLIGAGTPRPLVRDGAWMPQVAGGETAQGVDTPQ